jgi:hypothetical protein
MFPEAIQNQQVLGIRVFCRLRIPIPTIRTPRNKPTTHVTPGFKVTQLNTTRGARPIRTDALSSGCRAMTSAMAGEWV